MPKLRNRRAIISSSTSIGLTHPIEPLETTVPIESSSAIGPIRPLETIVPTELNSSIEPIEPLGPTVPVGFNSSIEPIGPLEGTTASFTLQKNQIFPFLGFLQGPGLFICCTYHVTLIYNRLNEHLRAGNHYLSKTEIKKVKQ